MKEPPPQATAGRIVRLEAPTLHRLLGWRPSTPTRFKHDATRPLVHDLVVVDGAALESLGGAGGLSVRAKAALRQRVSARGVLVWGPHSDPATEAVDGWSMVVLTRPCVGDEDEVLLVAGRQAALPPTDLIEGFRALGGGVAAT